MTASLHLLAFELRRHVPVLVVGLGVIFSMPFFHRWLEGHWGFWSGDWPLTVAALGFGLMLPCLALSAGLGTWAKDRSRGTLGWLYCRPVGGVALFILRVLAVLVVLGLFLVAVTAVTGVGVLGLLRDLSSLSERAAWSVRVGLILTPLLAAIGLFASSLGSSSGRATLVALGTLLLFGQVLPWVASSQGTPPVLWAAGEALLMRLLAIAVVAASALLLLAAGRAVRHSPDDSKRTGRALRVLVPGLVLLMVGLLLGVRLPLRPQSDEVLASLSLGSDGSALHFVPAYGIERSLARPVRVGADGERRPVGDLFVPVGSVFADPKGSGAMVADFGEQVEWRYIHGSGEVDRLRLVGRPHPAFTMPIGWSPDGERFAWLAFEERSFVCHGLMVFEGSRDLRWVPFRSALPFLTQARWLASDRWAILDDPASTPNRWRVLSLNGEALQGLYFAPADAVLAPAGAEYYLAGRELGEPGLWQFETRRASFRAPSFGDRWLARQVSGEGRGWVILGPGDEIEPYPHLTLRRAATVGVTPEGQPLRANPDGTVERLEIDGSAVEVCRFPTEAGWFAGFRGSWAVWLARQPAGLKLACHVATGEVRTRLEDQPVDLFAGFDDWEVFESPATPGPVAVEETP